MSQTILCLRRIHWYGRNGGLAKHVYGCARGIGAIAEQLRFSGCCRSSSPGVLPVSFGNVAAKAVCEAQSSEAATNAMPGGLRGMVVAGSSQWRGSEEPDRPESEARAKGDCGQPWRRRQSVGVSPVNFRNAAANAVCEA
ncbi:hypothetical protein ELH92_22350 [Rhizobium ruizarguesonis]|nr:hypothetical protein ELH92_22350 [Rhizobium ruizarguesonis]